MSSFSGLNTALTSLVAQRQAIEVASQNISNVNTPGYTRQRVTLAAVDGSAAPSMASTPGMYPGGGVAVTSMERLSDVFLEARVRNELGTTNRLDAEAKIHSLLESTLHEPSENGLAATLDTFFASWADVSNRPNDAAAAAVLIENATSLVTAIRTGYEAATTEWASTRSKTEAAVVEVNTTATAVADLNERIRAITISGGNANTLIDERNQHINTLSALVGAEARPREDGVVDVMLGGNALVRGTRSYDVELAGAGTYSALTPTDEPRLVWAAAGDPAGVVDGEISGLVRTLGSDGVIASLAESYNHLVDPANPDGLVARVNAAHTSGFVTPPPGTSAPAFFIAKDGTVLDAGSDKPYALFLASITDPAQLAVRDAAGGWSGTAADVLAQLAGPVGESWSAVVVSVGVESSTATRRAANAASSLTTAEGLLLSQTGVNLDEETVDLLSYQRAYEAAARVMTTVDQMLDTLINRTGVVGR